MGTNGPILGQLEYSTPPMHRMDWLKSASLTNIDVGGTGASMPLSMDSVRARAGTGGMEHSAAGTADGHVDLAATRRADSLAHMARIYLAMGKRTIEALNALRKGLAIDATNDALNAVLDGLEDSVFSDEALARREREQMIDAGVPVGPQVARILGEGTWQERCSRIEFSDYVRQDEDRESADVKDVCESVGSVLDELYRTMPSSLQETPGWSEGFITLNAVRTAVSLKKRRFVRAGFDLDLTYITPQLIAMGFPSEGKEAKYRNPMAQVQSFFKQFHAGHYKVYNLCSEREYEEDKFEKVKAIPFHDHNPPSVHALADACEDIFKYISADARNVAAVHCKAGKGRTGLVCSAVLLRSGEHDTAEDALKYFGILRTENGKGVTIASQRRYVHYYGTMLQLGIPLTVSLSPPVRTITAVRIFTAPKGGCFPMLWVSQPWRKPDVDVWDSCLVEGKPACVLRLCPDTP